MNMYPSDKKKLLSLPFYMAKRIEDPKPARGQDVQTDLFKEMSGINYHSFENITMDPEHKITEFEYEKFLNPEMLKNVDTNGQDFKNMVKALNYFTKTKYESWKN